MNDLEALIIPLDGIATDFELPHVIYSTDAYEVTLDELTAADIERAFRLRIIEDPETGVYHMESTDEYKFFGDDHIMFFLHGAKHQIRVTPKGGLIDEKLRERVSMGLECALGFFDEHVSWLYPTFATVASRGMYRSHKSTRRLGNIGQPEVDIIQKILQFKESEHLTEHKFDTLRALFNSARHQSGASDVACVLYFSVLEAIYVQSKQELTYKLAMRLTKKLGKDYRFARKIIDMYTRRGDVIHGKEKGDVFSPEEHLLLESLAKDSFISFIADPRAYSNTKLDKLLLE